MIKLGVLISGSGTNLQAMLDAIKAGYLDARVAVVISSKPDAYGLTRAEKADIPTLALSREDYCDPLSADRRIVEALQGAKSPDNTLSPGVDYVVMAGYMRKVREPLLTAFPNRIVNIHPALLPSFVGAHAIEDALASGVKITGITVHFANEDYDKGPIIAQRAVTIAEEDNLESLTQKIHEQEHILYPEVLQLLAEDRVRVDADGIVHIL